MPRTLLSIAALLFQTICFVSVALSQAITVYEPLGTSRAFIVIRDASGHVIGHGEATHVVRGLHVTAVLSLHFRDGSLDEETAHFLQTRTLQFVDDHHIQRGPFFSTSLDMSVKRNGQVSFISTHNGKTETESKKIELPTELANGFLAAAILNFPRDTSERSYSFIAPTSKARLIKIKISKDRIDKFSIAGKSIKANVLRMHYELGGIAGAIAPVIGKQPEDAFVWVTTGVPTLVREQASLYEGGPIVSIEIAGAAFEK